MTPESSEPGSDSTAEGGGGGIDADALVGRLKLIEDQPLESRAEAFARVHDALRSTLEGGDSGRADGPRP